MRLLIAHSANSFDLFFCVEANEGEAVQSAWKSLQFVAAPLRISKEFLWLVKSS
jgi:hypothetical protein